MPRHEQTELPARERVITHTLELTDAEAFQLYVLSRQNECGHEFPYGLRVDGSPRCHEFFTESTRRRFKAERDAGRTVMGGLR